MAPIERATLRPIVYYEFLQGHSARAAADNISAAFKGNVVHYSTVSRWFKRLESGDTTFGDRPRSGRPSTVDDEVQRNALNAKPNATTRESATTLGVTHMAIGNHLNDLGRSFPAIGRFTRHGSLISSATLTKQAVSVSANHCSFVRTERTF